MKKIFSITSGNLSSFDTLNLKTSNNEEITANVGQYLELAGPDFSMLKITMGSNVGWKRRDSPKIF
jgi:hypothetical protein